MMHASSSSDSFMEDARAYISDPMSSSMLTLQHNLQVQQLSERLDALTPRGGSTKKKGGPTKQQLAQAEEAARIKRDVAFDGGLWQVERMLGQFVCPTHVAAPPARKNPEVASVSITINQEKPLTFAEIKENQRLASERLYRGTSFAASSASAAASERWQELPVHQYRARARQLAQGSAAFV